jgi:hypothetical protein
MTVKVNGESALLDIWEVSALKGVAVMAKDLSSSSGLSKKMFKVTYK